MNNQKIIEKLSNKAIFSIQDIQRIGNFSREYTKILANRLTKRKIIQRVTRNKYTLEKNIYAIATNLKTPSYLSFWSASIFYGFTEQIINTVQIATTRRAKEIIFQGSKIKFIKINNFFGYKKIKSGDSEIFLVEQEKLVIDILMNHKEMGNFDEIIKIIENAEINKEKLKEYLIKINNNTLKKRAGYLIEKYKNIDISDILKKDNNYVYLNPFSRRYKTINTKWKVKI